MTVLLALACTASGQTPPSSQTPEATDREAAWRGEELFAGKIRFRNGGPACAACHSVSGIPFPNGGTLGPDLTNAYQKLGPQGMRPAMQTLFFRVMTPIFDQHPLTSDEQSDLIAFFRETAAARPPRWDTQIITAIGVGGCVILLVITGAVWHDRLKSVRKALVERAKRQEKIA